MFKKMLILFFVCCTGIPVSAQSLEDLNVQIHGFATQGFLYTTNNNIFTTTSSNGSPNWTEAVINLSVQPIPKLRISVQPRYELLGNYSNGFSLDYAQADYKQNDEFGLRFGKVKIPSGLFNEIQDIDPSYMWSLLPQSIYPLPSRNGQLSEYGGVVYGTLSLKGSPKLGKLEYRAWGGEVALSSSDGYLTSFAEGGISLPNGLTRTEAGAALRWRTPIHGLMIGVSQIKNNTASGNLTTFFPNTPDPVSGAFVVAPYFQPDYFGQYLIGKFMVAAEYTRLAGKDHFQFPAGAPAPFSQFDDRSLFGMASYKITQKLSAGLYYSQQFNVVAPLGPPRYSKDWALSARYDFNQYLYVKFEEHFIDGTAIGYDTDLNPNGLKATTRLTILKAGVSF
jgi:hypothetical protein